MGYSGAGGKLIHEKSRSKKSRDNGPLKSSVDQSELHAFPLCILQCHFYIFFISKVFLSSFSGCQYILYTVQKIYGHCTVCTGKKCSQVFLSFLIFFQQGFIPFRFVYVRCFFFYMFTNHIICRAGLF